MSQTTLTLIELQQFDPQPSRRGREDRYCCPLPACIGKPINRAHQSLSVRRETGEWNCHRCKEGGVLKEFWKHEKPLTMRERRRFGLKRAFALGGKRTEIEAAVKSEITADNWRQSLASLISIEGSHGEAYLRKRGISLEIARLASVKFHPAFSGRPAVVFPIRDVEKKLIGAQGRYIEGSEDPKTRSFGKISLGYFATGEVWKGEAIFLTEAPIDALSLAEAGYPALALCGTALRKDLLPFAWKKIFLAFDSDEAGERAAREWEIALKSVGAQPLRVAPYGAKDWNELLVKHGRNEISRQLQIIGNHDKIAGGRTFPFSVAKPSEKAPDGEKREISTAIAELDISLQPFAELFASAPPVRARLNADDEEPIQETFNLANYVQRCRREFEQTGNRQWLEELKLCQRAFERLKRG